MTTITCARCGLELAIVQFPEPSTVRDALKGSPYAALAGLIPAEYAQSMVQLLVFTHVQCPTQGASDVSEKEERHEGGATKASRTGDGQRRGEDVDPPDTRA